MSPDTIEAEMARCDARTRQATLATAQAFTRLLQMAEERDSGQIQRIAHFLAATYNGQAFPFDLFEWRAVDVSNGDDMLCCLDALRWARADPYTLVPNCDARLRAVIKRWGLRSPSEV